MGWGGEGGGGEESVKKRVAKLAGSLCPSLQPQFLPYSKRLSLKCYRILVQTEIKINLNAFFVPDLPQN